MTDEQASPLEMAGQSLAAAEALAAGGIHRFAVSRCYYAMFYCAEALLLTKDLSFSKHSAVISAFGREFAKTGAFPTEFHRIIIDSRQLRERGDYDVLSLEFMRWLAQGGVKCLDLLPPMRPAKGKLYWDSDSHGTPLAHDVIARCLCEQFGSDFVRLHGHGGQE